MKNKSIDIASIVLLFAGVLFSIIPIFLITSKLVGPILIFTMLENILKSLPQKQYNRWFWMLLIPASLLLYNSLHFMIIYLPTFTNCKILDYAEIITYTVGFGVGIYGIILTLKNFKKIVHN